MCIAHYRKEANKRGKNEPPPHVLITQWYTIINHTLWGIYIPLVLPLLEVVASSKGHQMSVVGRGRIGDGASAANVRVAQLVGETLELICRETVVVPQDVVVRGSTCSLRGREDRGRREREERGRREGDSGP